MKAKLICLKIRCLDFQSWQTFRSNRLCRRTTKVPVAKKLFSFRGFQTLQVQELSSVSSDAEATRPLGAGDLLVA